MSLIVEDGTGKVDAESYNSVAEIIAILTKTGEEAAFAALGSVTIQEQVARKATRKMDSELSYRGEKKTAEQSLEWPRIGAVDNDGWIYSSTSLPAKLKEGHAQYCAAASVAGADLQPDQSTPGEIESESITVGPISVATTYAGSQSQSVFYRKATALLSELTESAQVLERA